MTLVATGEGLAAGQEVTISCLANVLGGFNGLVCVFSLFYCVFSFFV